MSKRRSVRSALRCWFEPARVAAPLLFAIVGCTTSPAAPPSHPSMAPATQPSATLTLDATPIAPMYYRLLPVDLPTVAKVVVAQNLDIQQARERLEASRGTFQGSVEALFPTISPGVVVQSLHGVNQNANGSLTPASFTNVLPSVLVGWIVNPGQAIYDIIAAKRRLQAADQDAQAAVQETLRKAALQYYDLVLAQAQVASARQVVAQASELQRTFHLRLSAGTGLPADSLRAEAALAAAEQEQISALNAFYQASIALTLTMHLDPSVMLVPQAQTLRETGLVRDDLSIDQMLATAVRYRPELQAIRQRLDAAKADRGAALWGALGPQFQAAYSSGSLAAHATGQDDDPHAQQKGTAALDFTLGLSTLGTAKTAKARVHLASLQADAQLDQARAAVISAQQASLAAAKRIPLANQQVTAADEALRLVQSNLRAGTMLALDGLQAQAAAAQAHLAYATAIVRYEQAEIDLLSALGLVDPQTVAVPPSPAQRTPMS
jgi:outer membrane protein TolC